MQRSSQYAANFTNGRWELSQTLGKNSRMVIFRASTPGVSLDMESQQVQVQAAAAAGLPVALQMHGGVQQMQPAGMPPVMPVAPPQPGGFCGQCGASKQGTPFCSSCGSRV
mmetsp:Transcript_63656/g.138469  ORF Transcript_63656/g.138469 Transcript_63656/m.138469 type:complete len:111 (-) Transcript_63656:80-412(-)